MIANRWSGEFFGISFILIVFLKQKNKQTIQKFVVVVGHAVFIPTFSRFQ